MCVVSALFLLSSRVWRSIFIYSFSQWVHERTVGNVQWMCSCFPGTTRTNCQTSRRSWTFSRSTRSSRLTSLTRAVKRSSEMAKKSRNSLNVGAMCLRGLNFTMHYQKSWMGEFWTLHGMVFKLTRFSDGSITNLFFCFDHFAGLPEFALISMDALILTDPAPRSLLPSSPRAGAGESWRESGDWWHKKVEGVWLWIRCLR